MLPSLLSLSHTAQRTKEPSSLHFVRTFRALRAELAAWNKQPFLFFFFFNRPSRTPSLRLKGDSELALLFEKNLFEQHTEPKK